MFNLRYLSIINLAGNMCYKNHMVGNVRCFHAAICSVCCYFCSAFVNVPGPSQCPADHVHRIVAQLPPVAIPELFLELCQHAVPQVVHIDRHIGNLLWKLFFATLSLFVFVFVANLLNWTSRCLLIYLCICLPANGPSIRQTDRQIDKQKTKDRKAETSRFDIAVFDMCLLFVVVLRFAFC